MTKAAETVFKISARHASAHGRPFLPSGEDLHDPGVVRDTIASLTPSVEPAVLRVEATGDVGAEADSLNADWLLYPDGSRPERLPFPAWVFNPQAHDWSAERRWVEAWEGCERGSWLACAAASSALPPRPLISALCDAASACAARHGVSGRATRLVSRVAEACDSGRTGPAEVAHVRGLVAEVTQQAWGLIGRGGGTARAAEACIWAGSSFVNWLSGASYHLQAWSVAACASEAATLESLRSGRSSEYAAREGEAEEARCADAVRARIGTLTALESLVRRRRR